MEHTVQISREGEFATVQFTVMQRPWTTNYERKGNRWVRSQMTAEWRQLFAWLTKAQRLPTLTDATVEVRLQQKGRLQDAGACSPAIKAAIDGFVDGGLLKDDDSRYLNKIVFYAPERAKHDVMTVTVKGRILDYVQI